MYRLHLQYFDIFLKRVNRQISTKLSTIFLKALNIYLFTKIFQNVKIVMSHWNILQYLTKMLRKYFNCNERLELFLRCFCNIMCYVGRYLFLNIWRRIAIMIFYIHLRRTIDAVMIRDFEIRQDNTKLFAVLSSSRQDEASEEFN